jgi:hypothetical protein
MTIQVEGYLLYQFIFGISALLVSEVLEQRFAAEVG